MSGRSAKSAATPGLILGGEPRVDLLPPEVADLAKARSARRVMALLVAIVVVFVAGGYGIAALRASAAQAQLEQAQERTVTLLAEEAQYIESTQVAALLATSEKARTLATSTEVLWGDVFATLATFVPVNSITTWKATSRLPWSAELAPSGPLRAAPLASITMTVSSASTFDSTALFRKLDQINGFADATVDSITQTPLGYDTTMTLNLDAEALSGRFAEEESE